MREKNYSKPKASTLVGCKIKEYTGKDGKKHVKGKGSFALPNGDTISLEVSRSSDEAEREKGILYWVNAALFSNTDSTRR